MKKYLITLICFLPICVFAQTKHLICEGKGIAKGTSTTTHNIRLVVSFNLSDKTISIDKLLQVAPGSSVPIQNFVFSSENLIFETPNEWFGGKGMTSGVINRFTGDMQFSYYNFGSSMGNGMATVDANLICRSSNAQQF